MKQVIDQDGNKIRGLFKKEDGSIVVIDPMGLQKSTAAQSNIKNLNNEVMFLRNQITEILNYLNPPAE